MIRQALSQVVWYPVIVFISYIFLVTIKISAGVGFHGSWAKKLMILSGCHGLLFSLVYLSLPAVRQQWKAWFISVGCGLCLFSDDCESRYSTGSQFVDSLLQPKSKHSNSHQSAIQGVDTDAGIYEDGEEDGDGEIDPTEEIRESSDDNHAHPYGYTFSADGSQRRTLSNDSSLESLVRSQTGVVSIAHERDSILSVVEAAEMA
jgi:hypothetical protein